MSQKYTKMVYIFGNSQIPYAMENTNKFHYCAFILSLEKHMESDQNLFVNVYCSILMIFPRIFYKMHYCGQCVNVAAFFHDKFYG